MNLHEKYTNNIVASDPKRMSGGVCRINEHTKGMLIEEVTKVEFNSLYANLLVRLYREGIIKRVDPSIYIDPRTIDKVEYFLKNRVLIKANVDNYIEYKTWINSLYVKEFSRNVVMQLFDIYYQYISQYCNDIQSLNKYTWLHTDTDQMLFAGEEPVIPDIGLPYSTEPIGMIYIEREKKYVEYTNDIKVKGYGRHHQPSDIISMMKQKIRERKLDSIGI